MVVQARRFRRVRSGLCAALPSMLAQKEQMLWPDWQSKRPTGSTYTATPMHHDTLSSAAATVHRWPRPGAEQLVRTRTHVRLRMGFCFYCWSHPCRLAL